MMKRQLLYLFLFLLPMFSWAQEDFIDNENNLTVTGPNGLVWSTTFQEDGKILIAGEFTSFDGIPYGRIARLNMDGSLDNSFNAETGANGIIYSTAILPDGKILIGGDFTLYDGNAQNYLARLNHDGSLDTSFNIGTGPNNKVFTIGLTSEGKIFIGGQFSSYNGESKSYFLKLNSDGDLDTSFNAGMGLNNSVFASAVQQDGKVLIGGDFTNYNGTAKNRIVRLNQDGSLDSTFDIGTGANNVVRTIAIQSDGNILLGGDFEVFNGSPANRIARFTPSGNLDPAFNVGAGPDGAIRKIIVEVDGKILVDGSFSLFNGIEKGFLIKLNNDGSQDMTF